MNERNLTPSHLRENPPSPLILTLLGPAISQTHLSRVSKILSDCGLETGRIVPLTDRPLTGLSPRTCLEYSISGPPADPEGLRQRLRDLSDELAIDIVLQPDGLLRRSLRLIILDMDSTLIQIEAIDELAKANGTGEAVARITEAAMRGELPFAESFTRRLAMIEGLEEHKIRHIADTLPLTDGAERLISTLKKLGYKTAVASGGFTCFGNVLREKLGLDEVHANELEIVNGRATGKVRGRIVDGACKAEILREITARETIGLQQVIAVGDGANDLPMIGLAGLGIAFHAKPIVRQSAPHAISHLGLDAILYLLGLSDHEIG